MAAWLSGQCSEAPSPGASEFESHRRRRIFSKEGTSAGPWICVYVFQGLTVGWWKEERHSSDHHREVGRVPFKSRPDGPLMDVVLCSYCVVQKVERREEGGRGWPGKVPRSPAAPPKEKRGEKEEKQQKKNLGRYLQLGILL
jgi:hypothetical protein